MTHSSHVAPFPDFLDEEEDYEGADLTKNKVVHVRLLPITWVWVRYEARRCKLRPSEWVREAILNYDDEAATDLIIKDKVLHVRVDSEQWAHLQKAARGADRRAADVIRRAINQRLLASGDDDKGKK